MFKKEKKKKSCLGKCLVNLAVFTHMSRKQQNITLEFGKIINIYVYIDTKKIDA